MIAVFYTEVCTDEKIQSIGQTHAENRTKIKEPSKQARECQDRR